MPVGAFGGSLEIMKHIAPLGNVYQAGTLSGNPIAMVAGFTLLSELNNKREIYNELEEKGKYLSNGLEQVLKASGIPFVINHIGSMLSIHFSKELVTDFASASAAQNTLFNKFFHAMLNEGIYLPPSAFESWFISNALSYEDLDRTIAAAGKAIVQLK
jgi:glutamate-1-semialdehyde 2,1-aminomutase